MDRLVSAEHLHPGVLDWLPEAADRHRRGRGRRWGG